MANPPRYPGIQLRVGDLDLVIPPITLGMLRAGLKEKMLQHDKAVREAADGHEFDLLELRGEIIVAALRRNYSPEEYSDAQFYDVLDMANVNRIWLMVIGLSGFSPGEAGAAAEPAMNPPLPPTDGTSAPSTPLSPPRTDGDNPTLMN